jgi:hypothetical protein
MWVLKIYKGQARHGGTCLLVPATWEAESPGKKLARPLFNQQAGCGGSLWNLCHMGGIGKRIVVRGLTQAKKNQDPIQKGDRELV